MPSPGGTNMALITLSAMTPFVSSRSLPLFAGMGYPWPSDPSKYGYFLTDWGLARFEAISFFLVLFFVSAWLVKLLWNYLRQDFPILPRLTYGKAVAGVFLWGMLFIIVLVMVAATRELMTPGAWIKHGFTYQLAPEPGSPTESNPDPGRRPQDEKIKMALWEFAALHQGRFPTLEEAKELKGVPWEIPNTGLRFFYVSGRSAGQRPDLLVVEPELSEEHRLALKANGDIVEMGSKEIRDLLSREKKP
jgi:hypothetical protein